MSDVNKQLLDALKESIRLSAELMISAVGIEPTEAGIDRVIGISKEGSAIHRFMQVIAAAEQAQQAEPVARDDAETVRRICELFCIGKEARQPSTIIANIENTIRRSRCLSAVEAKFFMTSDVDVDDDGERHEECMLLWGSSPDEYVKDFGDALAVIYAQPPAVAGPEQVDDSIGSPFNACCNKEHCRAMLSDAPKP